MNPPLDLPSIQKMVGCQGGLFLAEYNSECFSDKAIY